MARFDDLSVQTLYQRRVLGLRVADDNVVGGQQETVGNLSFCRKTLAGTGCAENQAVRVLQQLAVHHNEIGGQGVDAVIQRLAPILEKLLCREWHKMAVELVVSPR